MTIGDQLRALIGKTVIIDNNSDVLEYNPKRQGYRQAGDQETFIFRPKDVERIEADNQITLKDEFLINYAESFLTDLEPPEDQEYEGDSDPSDYDPADPDADFPGSGEE